MLVTLCVCLLVVELKIRQLCWSVQFVCGFVTCRNLRFRQVCWSVGLSVRLSVCLFVCVRSSNHNLAHFLTILFVQVEGYHGTKTSPFDLERLKDKVMKNLRKLEKSLSLTWDEISKNHNSVNFRNNFVKLFEHIHILNIS